MTPFTIRKLAATTGEPNRPRTNFSSTKPITTAGMVAMMISRNTRRLSRVRSAPDTPSTPKASASQSRQK